MDLERIPKEELTAVRATSQSKWRTLAEYADGNWLKIEDILNETKVKSEGSIRTALNHLGYRVIKDTTKQYLRFEKK